MLIIGGIVKYKDFIDLTILSYIKILECYLNKKDKTILSKSISVC